MKNLNKVHKHFDEVFEEIQNFRSSHNLKEVRVSVNVIINAIKDKNGNWWEHITTTHNERMAKLYNVPTLIVRYDNKDYLFAPQNWLLNLKREQ